MSISDKTRKSLEKIGLTSYEIRTFSSLLQSGESTASDLSHKSGVPYSKIYEVLGTLEDKGWIGSDDARPTKYFAKSPSTGLETTKQKMESDFSQDQKIILNELVPLYEKSGTSERPDIWVLSGPVNIASKILEMVD
ncbi:MAG: TrmB family transcriptional regulator, partial [Nitrosopumilus sp.]|nr:TrmB family transcriptional regulator [Nitrosopumilus sp.]